MKSKFWLLALVHFTSVFCTAFSSIPLSSGNFTKFLRIEVGSSDLEAIVSNVRAHSLTCSALRPDFRRFLGVLSSDVLPHLHRLLVL